MKNKKWPRFRWPASYRSEDDHWIVEIHREMPNLTEKRVVFLSPGSGAVVGQSEDMVDVLEHEKFGRTERRWTVTPHLVVDVGDWDGDGKAEVLAKFEGYNRDGYILLSDEGKTLGKFLWSYH